MLLITERISITSFTSCQTNRLNTAAAFQSDMNIFQYSKYMKCLPIVVLLIVIFSIESLFHLTTGGGLPCARHRNVKLLPSRTITSLELNESSIFGGTNLKE